MTDSLIYCRISKDEEKRKGVSIDLQVQACQAYAMMKGLNVEVITDVGRSGRDWKREGAQLLWEKLRNGSIKHVIVHRIDRLSRSIRDLAEIADFMTKNGVKFHSVQDQVDLDTPEGWLFYAMRGVVSEYERLRVSFNTSKALKRKQKEGIRVGRPPFGWKMGDEGLEEVPAEQEVIKDIKEMAILGWSQAAIALSTDLSRTAVRNILNRANQ